MERDSTTDPGPSLQALSQLRLFRRQYLQLLEPREIKLPGLQQLRDAGVQAWLYEHCFDIERNPRSPPPRYRMRVLKLLLAQIEQAIVDPEEDTVSDELMEAMAALMGAGLPPEALTAREKNWVTYSFLRSKAEETLGNDPLESQVITRENRSLLCGAGTTGLRTWEAALHLGAHLLDSLETRSLIRGKHVLELGAGSGFLSILCAAHLEAGRVVATDGDPMVLEELRTNLFYNRVEDRVATGILRWGGTLQGSIVEYETEDTPLDLVIGADVTYDSSAVSALVATLRAMFDKWPAMTALISATIRSLDTFEVFELSCRRHGFSWIDIDWTCPPLEDQEYLFHTMAMPIRIVKLGAPATRYDPFAPG